jgi:hypothetical protein
MKRINDFPTSVIENLKFYVYLLIDPINDEVFYVGKGTGNREQGTGNREQGTGYFPT